jgi:hypothetical protein
MKSVKSKKQIRKSKKQIRKSKKQIRKSKKQIRKSKKQIRKSKTRRRQRAGMVITKEMLQKLPDEVNDEYKKNPRADPNAITRYTDSLKEQVERACVEENFEFFENLADWEAARKDKIIAKIRKDTKNVCISCENTENKELLILEKYENNISEGVCGLFPIITLLEIEEGTIYNYILYKNIHQPVQILLSNLYHSPEIATKHNCLINRIPGNPIIIGAGELVLDDWGNLNYNCTSSLWFMKVFDELFPFPEPPSLRQINELIKEFYESEYIKAILFHVFFPVNPLRINVSYIKRGLTGTTSTLDFKKLCELPEKDDYCLKLVDKDSCYSITECPTSGEDFCTNEQAICKEE